MWSKGRGFFVKVKQSNQTITSHFTSYKLAHQLELSQHYSHRTSIMKGTMFVGKWISKAISCPKTKKPHFPTSLNSRVAQLLATLNCPLLYSWPDCLRAMSLKCNKQAHFTWSHGLMRNNTIDPHRILSIVGAWSSIMGWMWFLNSDDVVAVLGAILPFLDANAPQRLYAPLNMGYNYRQIN